MWTLVLQASVFCVLVQLPGCLPSCVSRGSAAFCSLQRLSRVPALPPHVTHLYLDMNRIALVDASSFWGLERLQVLDLGGQRVPLVIRKEAFSRLGHLRRLVLGSNLGLRLEPGAFAGLSRLQALHLDHCSLNDSILAERYLEPLTSLETLNLFGNQIKRVRPSAFFGNLTELRSLNLRLNSIERLCEADLQGFQGRHFGVLDVSSVQLGAMSKPGFDWKTCGNPFRGMSFQTLDLSHNGFGVAKSKRFFSAVEGTKISHLRLSGYMGKGFSFDNLPDPDNSTFQGLSNSSVLTLDLSKGRIFALRPGVFGWLQEVTSIDLSQNRVNQIHRNAFDGLEGHLNVLNLSHNLLGEYAHTFASLSSLKVLDLSHNHIGVLGYGSFRGLPQLEALFLTGNSLPNLGFPSPLPRLQYLLLGDNKLSSASGLAPFAGTVKHLDVQNRLTNLEDLHVLLAQLSQLQTLLFGGNAIRWCSLRTNASAPAWNRLHTLDLHGSSLQAVWQGRCLSVFDGLGRVLDLDLSSNALQTLPPGVFKGLASVARMDLSSNALTYLQPGVLPKSLRKLDLSNNFIAAPEPAALRSLSHLGLASNRFHCDLNLRSFLAWLNQTSVTLLSPADRLRCEFPPGLYKVPLLEFSAGVLGQP
uniref:TLR5S n=1 Tax=Tetraodon nigroviridis TaxID=99883 RepID=A0A8K1W4W6_TETNG|nr:TLR5S [Tetraodon nigroviridis]